MATIKYNGFIRSSGANANWLDLIVDTGNVATQYDTTPDDWYTSKKSDYYGYVLKYTITPGTNKKVNSFNIPIPNTFFTSSDSNKYNTYKINLNMTASTAAPVNGSNNAPSSIIGSGSLSFAWDAYYYLLAYRAVMNSAATITLSTPITKETVVYIYFTVSETALYSLNTDGHVKNGTLSSANWANYTTPGNGLMTIWSPIAAGNVTVAQPTNGELTTILNTSYTVGSTSFSYDGSTKTCVTSYPNCTISGTNSTASAGSYSVTIKTNSGYQFSDGTTSKTVSWSISKRDITITAGSNSRAYNGSALTNSTVTLSSGSICSGESATYSTSGSLTNVGSSNNVPSVVIKRGTTDVTTNYNVTKVNGTLTITNATLTVTANDQQFPYDGSSHGNAISATSINNLTITIKYGTSNGTYNLTSAPKITNVSDSKTIYYQVSAPNHSTKTGSYSLSISKASGSITGPTAKTLTYNESEQYLVNAGSSTTGTVYYKVNSGQYSTSIPKQTNADTYTVYYYSKGDGNHNDTSEYTIDVTINKRTVTITAPTINSNNLIYNKTNQNLVNSGNVTSGGTIYYCVSTSNTTPTFSTSTWSTSVPSKTDANTYYIWYYCYSDANNNTGTGINTVTLLGSKLIDKAQSTMIVSPNVGNCFTTQSIDISNNVTSNNGSVTYSIKTNGTTKPSTINGSTVTIGEMSLTSDDDQTVVIDVTDSGTSNYYGKTLTFTITAKKYPSTLNWNNATDYVNQYSTLSILAIPSSSGGTLGGIDYSLDTDNYATLSGSTISGVKYSGSTVTIVTAHLNMTSTTKESTITRQILVKDNTSPTLSISGGINKLSKTLIVTLDCNDNTYGSGVDSYYWGTNLSGEPNTKWNGSTTKTINSAGTYYFIVKDNVGNKNTNSIDIVQYSIVNLLEKMDGITGLYTSKNYEIKSLDSFIIKEGTNMIIEDYYNNPSTKFCEYKGYSTEYGSSLAELSKTSTNSVSCSYYSWFDRDHLTIPYLEDIEKYYTGEVLSPTIINPTCSHSGAKDFEVSEEVSAVNAGEYTIKWTLKSTLYQKWIDNTTGLSKTDTWIIFKVDSNVDVTANDVYYDELNEAIAASAKTKDCDYTLGYSLVGSIDENDVVWIDENTPLKVPSDLTPINDYNIWIKGIGDENHNDLDPYIVATISIRLSDGGIIFIYDGDKFIKYIPFIWHNGEWVRLDLFIYHDNKWTKTI